jgi:putative transcriptional regulator
MSKQYRSDAMASIHETMEALHKVGAIDRQTMRRPVEPLTPRLISKWEWGRRSRPGRR